MKKILLTLLLLILFIPGVNAEEVIFDASKTFENANSKPNALQKAYEIIETSDYKYYTIITNDSSYVRLHLFNEITDYKISTNTSATPIVEIRHFRNMEYTIYEDGTVNSEDYSDNPNNTLLITLLYDLWKNYSLYDTNFNYTINTNLNISGIYSDTITLKPGDLLPKIKTLQDYDSWTNYTDEATYIEVNLNNYEYVILNLKNYNTKDPFNTNLKVKGMIGITPVYNFGQIEKVEVTDRCNTSYEEYTDYRFSILKNDLMNYGVYYVKACQENSSFKFNSSIFNITYVTPENVNDPVITFGGVKYNTIPFNKLSNSANQNEENNFIPGASEDSLANIVDNIEQFSTDIWNAVQSFMGLVTKFFNTLPPEFRYLSITAFTVLIFIAIIKFVKG